MMSRPDRRTASPYILTASTEAASTTIEKSSRIKASKSVYGRAWQSAASSSARPGGRISKTAATRMLSACVAMICPTLPHPSNPILIIE